MYLLDHLVRSVDPLGHQRTIVAIFTAYFDANGTKRSRVTTMAGFVAPVGRWLDFEKEWGTLLPPEISHFHMTDFVTSANGWETWKGKSSKRAWFVGRLAKCIRTHVQKGFAVNLIMNDFRRIDKEYKFSEEVGAPYPLLGIASLSQLKAWTIKKHLDYKDVLCIFEDGDENQGMLIDRARAEGFNAITQSKGKIRAFDACDLAAWKAKTIIDDAYVRRLHERDPNNADKIMRSLVQLEDAMSVSDHKELTLRAMRKTCENKSIAKRVGSKNP